MYVIVSLWRSEDNLQVSIHGSGSRTHIVRLSDKYFELLKVGCLIIKW